MNVLIMEVHNYAAISFETITSHDFINCTSSSNRIWSKRSSAKKNHFDTGDEYEQTSP